MNGWPVTSDEIPETSPNYEGLGFIGIDTTIRKEEDLTIYIIHYKVKSIRFDYEKLSGSIPPLSFSESIFRAFSRT